jgi:glycosyltransferase involved in cell wall biosynthesis
MIRRFRSELKSEPLDLVHVKTSSGINFYQNALYALVARLSGVPVLLQIHSGRFEVFYRKSLPPLRVWIRSTLSRAKRVAVLSHSWAERLAAIAPGSEIRVVPNGLDGEEMSALGAGGEIRPSQVLFLGTGRDDLNRDKGLEDLISVLPDLARAYPQSRWILAGLQTPDETSARLRRAGLNPEDLDRRVVCKGLVDPPEKLELLRTSAILVLPSYFENMPNILLEGMAAGVGVVATDVGAIPEMLGYGEGGLLIPPGDRPALATALDRLLSSPTLVRAQARRNRTVVGRDYSMKVVERRLKDLYLETAGWPVSSGAITPSAEDGISHEPGRDLSAPVSPVSGA